MAAAAATAAATSRHFPRTSFRTFQHHRLLQTEKLADDISLGFMLRLKLEIALVRFSLLSSGSHKDVNRHLFRG